MKKPAFLLLAGMSVLLILQVGGAGVSPRQSWAQSIAPPVVVETFSREELAQMLGPFALYPDRLLSQVLIAATYPIEVVEADRWMRKNPGLQGEALDRALLDREWDPSVKALCHFPAILALMSERIGETTTLGNAFLAQEAEVMAMIQELRARAQAQGNLTTTAEQQVIVEQETIIIEPANPRVVYVPYYDPFHIYGPWWYPAYRPSYWGPPGIRVSFGIAYWPGVHFALPFGHWHSFNWHHRHIYVHAHERPKFVRHDRWLTKPGPWHHSSAHRRGVAYRDKFTAAKYGQYPQRPADFRREVRGFSEPDEPDREFGRRPGDGRSDTDGDRRSGRDWRNERSRQEQQRVEGELQRRERQPSELRERSRQPQPERSRIERGTREPERIGAERRERSRSERMTPERQRIGQDAPRQDRRQGEAIERERTQRSRDTIFQQGGDGKRERQSGERGRYSRQGRGDDVRERGHPGGDNRGGREGGWRLRR